MSHYDCAYCVCVCVCVRVLLLNRRHIHDYYRYSYEEVQRSVGQTVISILFGQMHWNAFTTELCHQDGIIFHFCVVCIAGKQSSDA